MFSDIKLEFQHSHLLIKLNRTAMHSSESCWGCTVRALLQNGVRTVQVWHKWDFRVAGLNLAKTVRVLRHVNVCDTSDVTDITMSLQGTIQNWQLITLEISGNSMVILQSFWQFLEQVFVTYRFHLEVTYQCTGYQQIFFFFIFLPPERKAP